VASRTAHPLPADAVLGDPKYGVSVLVVNADMTAATLRLHPDLDRDRYVIGVWSWELDTFPPAMHPAFGQVDEIWTISEFCAAALREHAPVPVHPIPVPVRDPLAGRDPARTPPGPGEPTRFLYVFDHNSVFARKNPLAAVDAFRTAFPDRTDVVLTIKTINGDKHPGDSERLRLAVDADDRIELIDQDLSAAEVADLFATAHGYVSLHRSEGFGLTLAEAMAAGVAVLAVRNPGTHELCGPAALLVEADELADGMVRLHEQDELRAELARRGRERAERFSWAASAERHEEAYVRAGRVSA
jgi:glycosyltransferase involved in cell wall biosynthesis